jgi:hypothetical protein
MGFCSALGVIPPLCNSKDQGKSVQALHSFRDVFLSLQSDRNAGPRLAPVRPVAAGRRPLSKILAAVRTPGP